MNRELIERLRYRQAWLRDFLIYKEHTKITDKVSSQIYSEIPVISLLFKIYFLPTTILGLFVRLIQWHNYNKCLKEIRILKEEINKNEENFIQKS